MIGIPTSPPNVIHVPAIVAKDLRLYKKAGLDVEIVSLGDSTKVYRALLAGNINLDGCRADVRPQTAGAAGRAVGPSQPL